MAHQRLRVGDKAHDFDFNTPWSSSRDFFETIEDKPAILVFLRYQGCPVCQMEMARLKREIDLFRQKEAKLFVFLQSSPERVASATNESDWPFFIVCDPEGAIFRQYNVDPGGIVRYLHPAGLVAAVKAVSQGFSHGRFEGRETQLPAAFVVNSEKIIAYAYYGRHIGDIPSPPTLASKIE